MSSSLQTFEGFREKFWGSLGPQTGGSGFKKNPAGPYLHNHGGGVGNLPPLSSDLMEEGGSHTVLFSYKGSKGPSCPHRTGSVGRPSETGRNRRVSDIRQEGDQGVADETHARKKQRRTS